MSELKATPGPWSIYNMVHAETGNRMTPEAYDSLKALLDALDDKGSCQYEALREEGRDALAKSRGES